MAESLAPRELRVPVLRIVALVAAYLALLIAAVLIVVALLGQPPWPVIFVLMLGAGILAVSLRRQRIALRREGLAVVVGGFGVPSAVVAWSACSPFRLVRRLGMPFAEADGAPTIPAGQWGVPAEEFVALLNSYRSGVTPT
jgi:hypothetical protein